MFKNRERQVQVNFRMPEELHNWLKEQAARRNRSVTAEIVERLEASVMADGARKSLGRSEEPHLAGESPWTNSERIMDMLASVLYEVREMQGKDGITGRSKP